jgi:tetratricopeptide (TPR) repeat protein
MSALNRHWLSRHLAFGAYLALLCALCVVAVLDLVGGEYLSAALTVAVLLADFGGSGAIAVGTVCCLVAGAYLSALLALGLVVTRLLGSRSGHARFDPEALAADAHVPMPLLKPLREISGGGRITTRSVLALAIAERPTDWEPLLAHDPGEDSFDGPSLHVADVGECSQYAAEALVIAAALAEGVDRPPDVQLLGAIAATVPLGAASDWVKGTALPEAMFPASPEQLVAAAAAFAATPLGADLRRRVEMVDRVGAGGEGVQREHLASASAGTLARAAGLAVGASATATAYAYISVLGELLLDLLRWLLTLPLRTLSLPGRVGRALFASAGRRRVGGAWSRLIAPWSGWPATVRMLWLCGRPLLGLAAFVAIAGFGSLAVWIDLPLALVAIAVRSVRLPLVGLVAAVAVWPVSPPGAALLAARALLVEAIVWWLGRRSGWTGARRRGLAAVAAARLDAGGRLTGNKAENLESARAAFAEAVDGDDEDTVLDRAMAYGVAAWAAWRWQELLGLVGRVVRGVLRGRWTGPIENAGLFDREFMSLALIEELFEVLGRWVVLAAASALAFFGVSGGGGLLGDGLGSQLAAAAVTFLVGRQLTERQLWLLFPIFWAGVAWVALGPRAWKPIAIAIAAAFAIRALRRLSENFSLRGRARWHDWPPPKRRPRRLRRHWQAASKAIDAGNERLGIEMLKELAEDAGSDEVYAAAALGRLALVEIDLGRLQAAAAHLDEVSAGSLQLEGTAAVAAGILAGELGDYQRSAQMLGMALDGLDPSSPLALRATQARAEALAYDGDPEAALELVNAYGARPFALRGVAGMLEAQVAIAVALVSRAGESREDEERAAKLLGEFKEILDPDELGLSLGPAAKRRLQRAQAQLLALHGQFLLARNSSEAAKCLRQAVDLAVEAGDEALCARAQVMHGSALARSDNAETGTEVISSGVEVLEARRTQLRAGERRTAMIAAGEVLYSAALEGFLAAQRKGCEQAGAEAAKLIESLRQSALAATLRAGSLPLDRETEQLIERALSGEREGADVEALRALIGEQVSGRFAASYLPTAVTIGSLLQVCNGFDHVLSFHVPPNGLPGWRVWISGDGTVELDRIVAGSEPRSLLAAIAAAGKLPDEYLHLPLALPDSIATWEQAGEELLPLGMRKALLAGDPERPRRVLIVPDGALALIPWAALRIGGRPLIDTAVLRAVPALELAGSTQRAAPAQRVVAHLASTGDGAELGVLRGHGEIEVTTSRDAFLEALRSDRFDGAYVASHGSSFGLRQQVEFADGSGLSAASALAYEWPAWTVFSSCLVGRVEQIAGREPFGMAISCMLRGADTIFGSVVELSEEGALVCGEATAGLAVGRDAGEALRAAQLHQLERRRLSSVADGLGLVCISTAASER